MAERPASLEDSGITTSTNSRSPSSSTPSDLPTYSSSSAPSASSRLSGLASMTRMPSLPGQSNDLDVAFRGQLVEFADTLADHPGALGNPDLGDVIGDIEKVGLRPARGS